MRRLVELLFSFLKTTAASRAARWHKREMMGGQEKGRSEDRPFCKACELWASWKPVPRGGTSMR
ncbi:hypothetical protein ROS1_39490 [Roseibium sp. ROS1]